MLFVSLPDVLVQVVWLTRADSSSDLVTYTKAGARPLEKAIISFMLISTLL